MKKAILTILLLVSLITTYAGHIAGGEMYYEYIGPGTTAANTSRYRITLRLFRDFYASGTSAPLPGSVMLLIYNNTTPASLYGSQVTAPQISQQDLALTDINPCINGNVTVRYLLANYSVLVDLPNTASGYVVMYQTCCRSVDINNIQKVQVTPQTLGEGATYTCNIPGTGVLPLGVNSSPVFALKDTTLVCQNSPFILDFSATDPDQGDSLSYSLCAAFDRGNTASALDPNYSSPPFNPVGYVSGFSGTNPLGTNATIDPVTGIISGLAPASGYYVINVCITEWRNGVAISQHRKDFTLRVSDCSLTGASLKPTYITCNGFTMNFKNESPSPNIIGYLWDFGERGVPNPTSIAPTPTHTYSDTGTFVLKLKVNNDKGCEDSTTAQVRVYPGFVPDFNVQGTCYLNNFNFTDATTTAYGVVNSWRWDLGDLTTAADTSRRKDTIWKYATPQTVQVKLVTTNSKGCIDSITKPIIIRDKPLVNLAFRDTLICSIDTLTLQSTIGSGTVAWTTDRPASLARMLNINTPNPIVYPVDTTRYFITINDNGCINTDTVTVNVLDFIDVELGLDTSICRTDQFTLSPVSDALSYQWTTSTGVTIPGNTKYPLVQPLVSTMYYVTANLGYCQDRDSVFANVAPYPQAIVRSDTTICFGDRVQLAGVVVGAGFNWSPSSSLINANTLFPIAGPSKTTQYILTAIDTLGCNKPVRDTVTIFVTQPLTAYAGKDTFVVAGRPVQLLAEGGNNYLWTPTTGLDNPTSASPTVILPETIDSIRYIVRAIGAGGCYDEDDVIVRVFKTGPNLFVPSAFTPNGDGKNDIVRPVGVGIATLQYFRVYNRWGQLVFSTSQTGKGWDGIFNGTPQPSGTYVFEAVGTDQSGNRVYKKGTIVLIR
ncbi:MAG: PKD domain-containing protein [Sediminibacterium sp.]|jgi:gliding motility-associated-like protein|uniref:PKD domain-containing protein n=1 Tax=Sediminibacterium sp. TaxID=1917865 RepID=UPI002ABB56E9|nr:PKD domain-containing protein [Sediminibacterium sp.]MDZ4070542.1 PKD domain-containing protein [Sediminibacterium sp.]